MSADQPSSGRPTGPPSGPLSGPSRPGPPPSTGPTRPGDAAGPGGTDGGTGGTGGGPDDTGGGSGGPGGPGGPGGSSGDSVPGPGRPGRPWWRSAPRVALIATAAVVAVVLAVVLTRTGGSGDNGGGEVFLQAAGKSGPDPFTRSTAVDSSVPQSPSASPTPSEPANVTRAVDGSAPGLYGGTRNTASCDVEKQIRYLQAVPAKNEAFADVVGVRASGVPGYLRALTPVQLRMDTRVTNHGYRDGAATAYQAVLQAGTAVLVDDRGVPRVRCACGNPLRPPVALKSTPEPKGDAWPSYRPQNVVVVERSTVVVNVFVLYDPSRDDWFSRRAGDTGDQDRKTTPPVDQPSPSVSTPSSETPPTKSPEPCPSTSKGDARDGTGSPCPSSSPANPSSSNPPAPESSTSAPPQPQPQAPETSGTPPNGGTTSESAPLSSAPASNGT
ncbi:DUF6777 domain-containing protein [Streptomyces heilongjiangensis]|uniref:DUF6777 domain-containing protein n=1 Tax=Streptomyces heilongjiangensis TaxID=945052 RepID=A0ABW1B8P4_9ACTN|nr:DUF6777 domain-containing protein [Streptomyces heilongjiangensis]MDC2947439.1 hypothetical protein [Streptomyces heilongjiangensis]